MRVALFLFISLFAFASVAEDVYQKPEAFIAEVFGGAVPVPKTLWITEEKDQKAIYKMMDRNYTLLKTKYWEKGNKTAWILEEIGKVRPITTGIVIENDAIKRVKVLIYRESHGREVKYPFFTEQFEGAKLTEAGKLTQYIDNISGATMSVDALRNLGELALFLHKHRKQ